MGWEGEGREVEGEAPAASLVFAEPGVPSRVGAYPVIDMEDLHGGSALAVVSIEEVQKYGRVHAAAEGDKDTVVTPQVVAA